MLMYPSGIRWAVHAERREQTARGSCHGRRAGVTLIIGSPAPGTGRCHISMAWIGESENPMMGITDVVVVLNLNKLFLLLS